MNRPIQPLDEVAEPIAEAQVVLTLVDGRPVYASPALGL
jgi:hypothetical protein